MLGKGLFSPLVQPSEAGQTAPSPQRACLPSALPGAEAGHAAFKVSVLHHRQQQSHGAHGHGVPWARPKAGGGCWAVNSHWCSQLSLYISIRCTFQNTAYTSRHTATATRSTQRGETAQQGRDHVPASPRIPPIPHRASV